MKENHQICLSYQFHLWAHSLAEDAFSKENQHHVTLEYVKEYPVSLVDVIVSNLHLFLCLDLILITFHVFCLSLSLSLCLSVSVFTPPASVSWRGSSSVSPTSASLPGPSLSSAPGPSSAGTLYSASSASPSSVRLSGDAGQHD